jgi:hypothetical protein
MRHFREAPAQARQRARERQKTKPKDSEALFTLTLASGMESDAESILQKRHLDGLKRMKEANAYAKPLLAQHPDLANAYSAPGVANYVIGSQSCRFPLRALVWWNSRRQKARHGASRHDRGKRPTSGPSAKSYLPLPRVVKIRLPLRKDCCAN